MTTVLQGKVEGIRKKKRQTTTNILHGQHHLEINGLGGGLQEMVELRQMLMANSGGIMWSS